VIAAGEPTTLTVSAAEVVVSNTLSMLVNDIGDWPWLWNAPLATE